jgi:DNA repair protein RadC
MQKSLFVRSGSRYRLAKGVEIMEAASFVEARRFETSRVDLSLPTLANQFLIGQLRHSPIEFFCVLYLDVRFRLISFEKMSRGTIDNASVHPREVVREVLEREATAIIISHNHPSGYAVPSYADREMTERLQGALALIDVRLLDHIIVGGTECYSFADNGLL